MKVLIDGVPYVPKLPQEQTLQEETILSSEEDRDIAALNVCFDSDAGDNLTVREYLCALLTTLWLKGEGFNGKRPFGNSGWEYDIITPLIKHGFIPGSLDSDGYINYCNRPAANEYVKHLISVALRNPAKV